MVKYSSFIIIASVFFLTFSCLGDSAKAEETTDDKFNKELFETFKSFFHGFTDISGSSNLFVKMMSDMADGMIVQYGKDKKQIQHAVTKGTEMGKNIQSVLQSLKKSSIPLTKELQAEVDEIEKHSTSEMTKLKGMSNVADIDGIEKGLKGKHADIKKKIQELFKLFLSMAPKEDGQAKTAQEKSALETNLSDFKAKLFAVIQTTVPVALSVKKNEDTIYKKMKTTYTTLSGIRTDLNRVEKIQYNLLRSCKAHSGKDASFLTRSLLMPCAFAILIGMVF